MYNHVEYPVFPYAAIYFQQILIKNEKGIAAAMTPGIFNSSSSNMYLLLLDPIGYIHSM